jgi:hypothetical protein
MFFDKGKMKLTFMPKDKKFAGKSSYFNLVIKEKGNDLPEFRKTYPCTVNVQGTLVEEWKATNFTDVKFKMTDVSNHSEAMMTFSQPLNLTFIS